MNRKKPPKGGGTFRRPGAEDRSDPVLWQQKIDSKQKEHFSVHTKYTIFWKNRQDDLLYFCDKFPKKIQNVDFLCKKKYCARK